VNVDEEYHEELSGDGKALDEYKELAATQPRVPQRVAAKRGE
jgi:hypothetical protein